MKRHRIHTVSKKGISLVEMMVAVAVMSIIVLAVSPMFTLTQKGYSSMEAHNALKMSGQETINRIGNKLTQCKRFFDGSAASTPFLARVSIASPTLLAGSKLPIVEETGTLSPSSSTFVASSVGNSVFFASIEAPCDVSVGAESVRIDSYQFNYYFLAEDGTASLGPQRKIVIWEWHSKFYVDYIQIMSISNVTKRNSVVSILFSSGTTYAWDPSATNVNSAFYLLSAGGGITAEATHVILQDSLKPMIKMITGVTAGGFRYGVSPNTGSAFKSSQKVPNFATANAKFPSGFELVVIGPNSSRQVFLRFVSVAQGSFSGYIADEEVLLATVRDLW